MNQETDRRSPSVAVCERYGISRRTLYRWMEDEKLGFPAPVATVNGRHYFSDVELTAWERARAARSRAA